jgi:hypothetical protein
MQTMSPIFCVKLRTSHGFIRHLTYPSLSLALKAARLAMYNIGYSAFVYRIAQ